MATQNTQVTSSVNPAGSTDQNQLVYSGLSKAGAGQAALIQELIYEMMDLYNQIVQANKEQEKTETEMVGTAATNESDNIQQSGKDTMYGALAGAGMSFLCTLGAAYLSQRDTGEMAKERTAMEDAGAEAKPLSDIDKLNGAALDYDVLDDAHVNVRPSVHQGIINQRVNDLRTNNWSSEGTIMDDDLDRGFRNAQNLAPGTPVTPQERAQYKDEITKRAIQRIRVNPDGNAVDYDAFSEQYRGSLNVASNQELSAAKRFDNASRSYQFKTDLLRKFGDSGSQVSSAVAGSYAKNEEGQAAIERAGGSLAGSQASQFGQNRSAAVQSRDKELDKYQQIVQTAAQS